MTCSSESLRPTANSTAPNDAQHAARQSAQRLYRYEAYGLTIDSALPLPELVARPRSSASADVLVVVGKVEKHPRELDADGRGFWIDGNQACYRLSDVGTFLVSDGQRIVVEADSNAPAETVRLVLLGPALALALHQRGRFLLHASAVCVDGEAVAFIGAHGWGKSTMAALLRTLGHAVVSDDITAIDLDGPTVYPSFPQLKLWPDALASLDVGSDALPQIHPEVPKRAYRIEEGFRAEPLRLRRLYALGAGPTVTIEKLGATETLEEIMRHWYGTRFGAPLWDSIDLRGHFLRASRLARAVPVRRIRRPATLAADPSLPQTIEREILSDLRN